jgi:predicted transcriptional regulator
MDVVWDEGDVTVRTVQDKLKPQRELAYTSVLTMMQVLERKGFVASKRVGRANVYHANVSRARFGLRGAVDIVNSFFAGSVPAMLSHFAETDRLSEEDIAKLRQIVDQAAARQEDKSA